MAAKAMCLKQTWTKHLGDSSFTAPRAVKLGRANPAVAFRSVPASNRDLWEEHELSISESGPFGIELVLGFKIHTPQTVYLTNLIHRI